MPHGVNARIGLLLAGLFILVSGSAFLTLRAIDTQTEDAATINLAGRQRMLIESMVADAYSPDTRGRGGADAAGKAEAFQITLYALLHGGPVATAAGSVVHLPPPQEAEVRRRLLEIQDTWGRFRARLDDVFRAPAGSVAQVRATAALSRVSPLLLSRMDETVGFYQVLSERKVARLRRIQMALLGAGLLILGAGFLMSRRSIVGPLADLARAARRIGQGDLAQPVPVQGAGEVEVLGRTLDVMRGQLKTSQEALVLSNQTLEERVARRTRELAALHQVSNEIASRLQVEEVLHSVVDKARELLRAEVAVLCFRDDTGGMMNVQAFSGPEGAIARRSAPAHADSPGVAPAVLAAGRAMACGVEDCRQQGCGNLNPEYQRSHLVSPLQIGGEIIGALCVGHRDPDRRWQDAVTLLERLAASASIALENARLHRQAERLAALEEREKVAADMHDGLAQSLSTLNHRLERAEELVSGGAGDRALQELERARSIVAAGVGQVRGMIADLRGARRAATLQDLLRKLRESDSGEEGPPPELDLEESPILLDAERATEVERILAEAVTNARKHAPGAEIRLSARRQAGEVECRVADRGPGFDRQAQGENGSLHFGLQIMEARAARIGARLEIDSRPGAGTTVVLSWREKREAPAARKA